MYYSLSWRAGHIFVVPEETSEVLISGARGSEVVGVAKVAHN